MLIVEDSPVWAALLSALCREAFGECEIVSASNWMTAVLDIRSADFVLIDWLLDNDVTADQCGALKFLDKFNIPHAIVTSSPEYVPAHVRTEIVPKDEAAIRKVLQDKRDALRRAA